MRRGADPAAAWRQRRYFGFGARGTRRDTHTPGSAGRGAEPPELCRLGMEEPFLSAPGFLFVPSCVSNSAQGCHKPAGFARKARFFFLIPIFVDFPLLQRSAWGVRGGIPGQLGEVECVVRVAGNTPFSLAQLFPLGNLQGWSYKKASASPCSLHGWAERGAGWGGAPPAPRRGVALAGS